MAQLETGDDGTRLLVHEKLQQAGLSDVKRKIKYPGKTILLHQEAFHSLHIFTGCIINLTKLIYLTNKEQSISNITNQLPQLNFGTYIDQDVCYGC